MHNIKLVVAYDGGAYYGWQTTRMGPSIESTLQAVLEQILQHPCPLQAASRTDRGVHARGQVVNFLTSKGESDLQQFHISLNSLLPKDIAVIETQWMPLSFHPTVDAIGKEYRYYVCTGPVQFPDRRLYAWHVHYPVNLEAIRQAIPLLAGSHDFSSFCNVKKNAHYTDRIREVQKLELLQLENNRLCFVIQGSHFLYKMVRNIVGTLIDIGRGKFSVEDVEEMLTGKSRPLAGVTAPAHGLFLQEVFY